MAGEFLEGLNAVMKRMNVSNIVRNFFLELHQHYVAKGLHPFEISAK